MTDDEFTPSPAQVSGTLRTLLRLMAAQPSIVELWARQLHEDGAPVARPYVDNADFARQVEHADALVQTFRWLIEHSNGPMLWQASVEQPVQCD